MEPNTPVQPQESYYGQEYAEGRIELPKTLRERLRDYYEDGDFVTVVNIDKEPIRYQFASPVGYETSSAFPGDKFTHQAKPPQVVVLQPGQMKLCPAYEADMMIENLIKQMSTRVTEKKIKNGEYQTWQTTNWQDADLHKSLIPKIFKGKQDLVSEANAGISQAMAESGHPQPIAQPDTAPTQDILNALDEQLSDEPRPQRGRPKTA